MTENKGFLNRSKGMDLFLKLTEFGMSKFLAATTAVLAYSWVQSITAHPAGQFTGMALIFLLVDFGITELLYFYFMERSQDETKTKARRAFLNLIISVVAFKMIATATSSFWAAPDLAEYITGEDKTEYYAGQIEATQDANNTRTATAQSVWEKLENSEAKRVEEAEQKGNKLIRDAVGSGTTHQVDMYKRNPGFFYALSRSSQYYKTNKAYIERIDAAKQEAKRLIQDEKNETKSALASFQGVESDTTTTATLSMLLKAAGLDQAAHAAKLSRRTNFLWMLDLFSAFGLILVIRARSLRLEAANHKGRQKTIVSAIAAISERNYNAVVNWLETFSGIDLDGNGTIGKGNKIPTVTPDAKPTVMSVRSDSDAHPNPHHFAKLVLSEIQALAKTGLPTDDRPTDASTVRQSPDAKPTVIVVEKPTQPTQKARRKTLKQERKATQKRECLNCDADISHRSIRAKYCSDGCRKDYHEKSKQDHHNAKR